MSDQNTQTPAPAEQTNVAQPVVTEQSTATQTPAVDTNTTQTEIKYLVDGSGKFVDGFEKLLPEDIRDHSAIKKHTNITDLFKAKIGAETLIGKKVKEYLDSDNPAVVAERNKHFGVPEKPEDYKIEVKMPEGMEIKPENIAAFREYAHKVGLPDKFASAMVQYEADLWVKNKQNLDAKAQAQKTETEAELRKEWTGDSYDKNLRAVKLLVTKEFGLTDADFDKPIGNNAALLKALASKVIPAFGEDRLIEGATPQSYESAETRLNALNREMISMNPNTPEYRVKLDEKKALLAKIR